MNDSDSDGEEEVEEEEVFRRLANVFQGSEHVSGQSSIGGVPITLFQKRKKKRSLNDNDQSDASRCVCFDDCVDFVGWSQHGAALAHCYRQAMTGHYPFRNTIEPEMVLREHHFAQLVKKKLGKTDSKILESWSASDWPQKSGLRR